MQHDQAMGTLDYERVENEFYPTPAWCTEGLCDIGYDLIWPHDSIWEPAAGRMDISKVLTKYGHTVANSDLVCYDKNLPIQTGIDFLDTKEMLNDSTAIVTNPPYGKVGKKTLSDEFVRHALNLTEPVMGAVAMLLRNEFDCAKGRRDIFQDNKAYAAKLVLTSRPRWFPDSTGSPRHNYSWFIWDWTRTQATETPEPTIRYVFK